MYTEEMYTFYLTKRSQKILIRTYLKEAHFLTLEHTLPCECKHRRNRRVEKHGK
jgi:hypothetical protein